MHCSAALRCVAGSTYQRHCVVQLWEAAPVDARPWHDLPAGSFASEGTGVNVALLEFKP